MKKGTKIGVGAALLLLGVTALSGCTQSFCSATDSARIMYAFEPGITRYEAGSLNGYEVSYTDNETGYTYKYVINNYNFNVANWDTTVKGFSFGEKDHLKYLNTIISTSRSNGYVTIGEESREYYQLFDQYLLDMVLEHTLVANVKALDTTADRTITRDFSNEKDLAMFDRDLSRYSYLKFVKADGAKMWANYELIDTEVRKTVPSDHCPSTDFFSVYKSKLNNYAATYRTCLTTKEDKYGSYGYSTNGVLIGAKSWGDAWGKGFFEGLLVYPIGWLIDQIVSGFRGTGASAGGAAFLGIVFVTLIIRSIMLLATIKQSTSAAKMNELQPEITKIQNKHPNANENPRERELMGEEMRKLYKKHNVNPFMSLIVMIVQFPVFICVWGALSGSSAITNGSFLGLSLSLSIKDALFDAANWGAAGGYSAVTALFLFLFMAGAQTLSMLLPQWIQKKKAKKGENLVKNTSQQSQNRTMKIFTYVMLAMIIFMGFSLVSAMGIYWFVGAIFSIIQTLVTQYFTSKKTRR